MKHYYKLLYLLLILFSGYSCASKSVALPEWQYGKEAIQLHIKADPKLNFQDGLAHTLLLCTYQLRNTDAFNQLTNDQDGLYKLLACELFDESVAASKSLLIHPGIESTFSLNRVEEAKHFAIVAGYYVLLNENMFRLYDIPLITEKGEGDKGKVLKPGILKVDITLGKQQILMDEK